MPFIPFIFHIMALLAATMSFLAAGEGLLERLEESRSKAVYRIEQFSDKVAARLQPFLSKKANGSVYDPCLEGGQISREVLSGAEACPGYPQPRVIPRLGLYPQPGYSGAWRRRRVLRAGGVRSAPAWSAPGRLGAGGGYRCFGDGALPWRDGAGDSIWIRVRRASRRSEDRERRTRAFHPSGPVVRRVPRRPSFPGCVSRRLSRFRSSWRRSSA